MVTPLSAYRFNWATGEYTDQEGNVVSWDEVNSNLILPNIEGSYTFKGTSSTDIGKMVEAYAKSFSRITNKALDMNFLQKNGIVHHVRAQNGKYIVVSYHPMVMTNFEEKGGWTESHKNGSSDYATGAGLVLDMVGLAAHRTSVDLKNAKFLVRGQNLTKQAKFFAKTSTKSTIAGAAIGITDNTIQAYHDFSQGNKSRGAVQAAQASFYTTGLVLMAVPGGQLFGLGFITAAGASDLFEYFIEQ